MNIDEDKYNDDELWKMKTEDALLIQRKKVAEEFLRYLNEGGK